MRSLFFSDNQEMGPTPANTTVIIQLYMHSCLSLNSLNIQVLIDSWVSWR